MATELSRISEKKKSVVKFIRPEIDEKTKEQRTYEGSYDYFVGFENGDNGTVTSKTKGVHPYFKEGEEHWYTIIKVTYEKAGGGTWVKRRIKYEKPPQQKQTPKGEMKPNDSFDNDSVYSDPYEVLKIARNMSWSAAIETITLLKKTPSNKLIGSLSEKYCKWMLGLKLDDKTPINVNNTGCTLSRNDVTRRGYILFKNVDTIGKLGKFPDEEIKQDIAPTDYVLALSDIAWNYVTNDLKQPEKPKEPEPVVEPVPENDNLPF